jgi:hypothetical protein
LHKGSLILTNTYDRFHRKRIKTIPAIWINPLKRNKCLGEKRVQINPYKAGPIIMPISSKEPYIPIDIPICSLGASSDKDATTKGLAEKEIATRVDNKYVCKGVTAK